MDQHWRAQARIGAGVSAVALAQWSRVSPLALAVSGRAWLAVVLALVRRERARSRETAAAFLRLYRAVETGRTLPPLDGGDGDDVVTLGELREEWARQSETVRLPERDDGERVRVDEFDWPEEPEDDHDRAAVVSLVATGTGRVQRELEALAEPDDEGPGRLDDPRILAELDALMGRAGAQAAGVADREALRGGRAMLDAASRADRRVIGWARVTDGDPCAWCAMLASRGAVYRSRAVAGIRGLNGHDLPPVQRDDLEKYHPMCHCQTVPVYSRAEFMSEQARSYWQQWQDVTRGASGPEALRAWRRHFDAQRRT
ncbi:hypothetical protein [Streptomyces sp. AV19]|uniref:VG15 protein n=1 Tax=Streptomyces sp. AV19 TaxID=2793068 RepID=UPI001F1BBBAB|nr:hypothetical protein [Streptomyces sp. AV19]MDG4532564.1 hypothetical protein [Streptomyces sp. AV19]